VTRAGRDRGAADALGLVLLAPAAIGLAVLVIALGRDVDARAQLRSAAAAGAQAAALERNGAAAALAAERVVAAMLVDRDVCPGGPDVAVNYPGVAAGGTVTVVVRCRGSDRGIELVRSGPRAESFRATATVDPFRARREP
jgi:hypothetical protein